MMARERFVTEQASLPIGTPPLNCGGGGYFMGMSAWEYDGESPAQTGREVHVLRDTPQ